MTILAAAALLIAAAACSNDDDPAGAIDNNETVPVHFSAGTPVATPAATPATRVAIDADGRSVWNQGDPVSISMLTHATNTPEPGGFNVPYTASSSGLSTPFAATYPERALRFPTAEGKRVDFFAYHPYVAGLADNNFTLTVDLADQSSQSALDLLFARADNNGNGYTRDDGKNNTPVNFTFRHLLAKLVLRVTKHPGVTAEITGVTINGMDRNFTINIIDGNAFRAQVADITPCTVTPGARYEAILAPDQSLNAANTVTFTTADGKRYTWEMYKQIPGGKMLSGKIYTFDITLTRYTVSATGSIDSWQAGATDTGEAS